MAFTTASLRLRVLQHLGIVAKGQTAEAEDASVVDEVITAVVSQLSTDGVEFSTADIPTHVQLPLRDMVCKECLGYFGIKGQEGQEYRADAARAEVEIKHQLAAKDNGLRIYTENF